MTNLNSDISELSMGELESVSGGGEDITFTIYGNTVHIGTDQTGAPYVSFHGADGNNTVTRGTPK